MNDALEKIYVKPRDGEFQVVKPGHRRGPGFNSKDLAIEYAREVAPLVLVLNRTGKVEREVRSEASLTARVAEYYAALAGEVRKDCDGHWSIVERWSYGEHLGWFVEHDGYCYDGFGDEYGEDGPHPTREAAMSCMAMHLSMAISEARCRW
ncbi:MAG TPA: hypothetical protein VNY83_05190 [Solirubrobacterales bacterium]|jgi:hypothetical protein|nr:hypothetical protein [Solirubrobacterales bacterium]